VLNARDPLRNRFFPPEDSSDEAWNEALDRAEDVDGLRDQIETMVPRLRAGLLVERWGILTRLTPIALA
jgi:hypothetical protein